MIPARTGVACTGSITIEVVIAFAVLALALAAVIELEAASDQTTLLIQTHESLRAQSALAQVRALDFFGITSATSTQSEDGYFLNQAIAIRAISPCLKQAAITVSATSTRASALITAYLASLEESLARGGDCDDADPASAWNAVTQSASDALATSTTAIDVEDGTSYLGLSASPYLAIRTADGFVSFQNSFSLPAAPNALDAVIVRDPETGPHRYVYAALNATTSQLATVNVDDPAHPVLTATRSFASVDPNGSFPQGWRVEYYDGRVYATARETAGPELHIFDASDPAHPAEYGSGTELGITINDFQIQNVSVSGVVHQYLYAATARDSGELAVYDVTNPCAVSEVVQDRIDLPGAQDGYSLALVGTRLYLGRESAPSGPDLYVFDANPAASGLMPLGSADVGASVYQVRVVGDFAFLATSKSGREVEVWNVENPSTLQMLSAYAAAGLPARGLDYEDNRLYVLGTTPSFQTLIGN